MPVDTVGLVVIRGQQRVKHKVGSPAAVTWSTRAAKADNAVTWSTRADKAVNTQRTRRFIVEQACMCEQTFFRGKSMRRYNKSMRWCTRCYNSWDAPLKG